MNKISWQYVFKIFGIISWQYVFKIFGIILLLTALFIKTNLIVYSVKDLLCFVIWEGGLIAIGISIVLSRL